MTNVILISDDHSMVNTNVMGKDLVSLVTKPQVLLIHLCFMVYIHNEEICHLLVSGY